MDNQYLTIKEFANQAGVSAQYVYKQINSGKLEKYAETVDGKKVLKPEALQIIGKQKHDNQMTTDEQSIVSFLQEQLTEKDRQIAELQKALTQAQELLRTEQNVRYFSERRILLLEGQLQTSGDRTTPEAEKSNLGASEDVAEGSDMAAGATDPTEPGQQTSQEVGKRQVSIWQRIQRAIRGQDKT